MNYLAHLFLSCEDEELMLGNFLADFVKNRYREELSPRVLEGIQIHRSIDSFTDRHPIVLQGTRRLYPQHRKYASILIDIFYDYLLVENWHLYSQEALPVFMERTYSVLRTRLTEIPLPFRAHIHNMIQHEWLLSYTNLEGMADTFERLKRRVSQPRHLEGAVDSLKIHHAALTTEFNLFFPELIAMVQQQCFC
ncbi:MAG: ACP phosphodiesterase [Bacteroidota bacterium]